MAKKKSNGLKVNERPSRQPRRARYGYYEDGVIARLDRNRGKPVVPVVTVVEGLDYTATPRVGTLTAWRAK